MGRAQGRDSRQTTQVPGNHCRGVKTRAECKGCSLRGTEGLQTWAAKVRGGQKGNSSQKAKMIRSLNGCGGPEPVWSDLEPQNVRWCVSLSQD